MKRLWRLVATVLLASTILPLDAAEVRIAVAANFSGAMLQLGPLFEEQTGHTVVTSFGATGLLANQIRNGAPFDVFLAADDETPTQLIAADLAVASSFFIYARGRLVLWSARPDYARLSVLRNGDFARIAISNPKLAPYGRAARETLATYDLIEALADKLVIGASTAHVIQFVLSGNIPAGFIAQAQLRSLPIDRRGSHWLVPASAHAPIDQAAVLLRPGHPKAASEFLAFLRSPAAVAVIRKQGYEVENYETKGREKHHEEFRE